MTQAAVIDSVSKASRYLSGLGGRFGFDEAVRRIEQKSSAEVGRKLAALAGWARGQSTTPPDPALALIGHVVRSAPPGANVGAAIGAADLALADARALADYVRSGIASGVAYSAALLVVAGLIASLWLTTIAPEFAGMFESIGGIGLPGLSAFFVDQPGLVFLAILALGAGLIALVVSSRDLARRIETAAPLSGGLIGRVLGARLKAAHDAWRALMLARAWTAGGGDPASSLEQALAALGIGGAAATALSAELRLADELGQAGGELDYLSLTGTAAYRDTIEIRRAVGIRVLQAAIAVLVGLIVIAIYLPLFSMGAIV